MQIDWCYLHTFDAHSHMPFVVYALDLSNLSILWPCSVTFKTKWYRSKALEFSSLRNSDWNPASIQINFKYTNEKYSMKERKRVCVCVCVCQSLCIVIRFIRIKDYIEVCMYLCDCTKNKNSSRLLEK